MSDRFDRAERQMSDFDRINASRRARERHEGLVRPDPKVISFVRPVSFGVTTQLVRVFVPRAAESEETTPTGRAARTPTGDDET